MNKKLVKGICLIGFGLGLVLMTTAPAVANQIVVCQSCTSAPGGDPNVITNPSSFNMFVEGNGGTTVNPTLVIIAEYDSATPTVTFNGGSAAPAPVGTFGLTGNFNVSYGSGSPDVPSALGLTSGGSLNFGNLIAADSAAGFAANNSTIYHLFVFGLATGLGNTPIQLGTTAGNGSFIFGYGCQTSPTFGSVCPQAGGLVSQSVMTNAGLAGSGSVPEPSSLLLLGAGLAGIGIWSWGRKARKV